ncbi:hypothetical protein [Paenibacillus chitinolyticus]
MTNKDGLYFDLSPEQLAKLGPIIETTENLKIAGTLEGNKLKVSFLACNAAFIACNAAFKIEASQKV